MWTGPRWLRPGFCFVGAWEPLVFRRRRGGLRTDEFERFQREHAPCSTENLIELGVDLVVVPFDKGFGATAQAEDLERSRKWSADLHAAGIKVGAYVRYDNLVPETIVQDIAHVDEWIARTGQGQPAAILNQSYRVAAQPTNEQHIKYVESLITRAIDELDADMIHLDGFWVQNLAWADTSEGTVSAFRAFLRERYTEPADAVERFGHDRVDLISPPVFREPDMGLDAFERVSDPVIQEWLLFRTKVTAGLAERFARTCSEAAARSGREVAFSANSLIPIGYSNGLYWGFEVDQNGPHLDAQWTEDDHWPALREDGVVISRIREFKIGAAVGTRVFSYQRALSSRQLELSIAQALVFNDGVIGMLGSPLVREEPFYEAKASAMTWVRAHSEQLAGNSSGADVALWRSSRTLMFEATESHRSVILAEQMLIQGRVPFDIVFDDVFDTLDRYRVLLLPDTSCMSEAQIEAVRHFVNEGGGVVATGRTSQYDEHFRLRPQPALQDVFGPEVHFDEGDFWRAPKSSLTGSSSSARHNFGAGRSVYFPSVETIRSPNYRGTLGEQPYRFPTEEWQLPLSTNDFLDGIAWARGRAKPLDVSAPAGVVVDLQTGSKGEVVIHLVDYDLERPAAPKVTVVVQAPGVTGGRIFPFGEDPQEITLMEENGIVSMEINVNVSTSVVLS